VALKNCGRQFLLRVSGRVLVFVDEAAEYLLSLDPVRWSDRGHLLECCSAGPGQRWCLAEGLVWPVAVVVLDVLAEDGEQVVLVDDEEPVEALAAQGSAPPFGERVRPRRLWWALEDAHAGIGEHGVERADELGVAIANKELHLLAGVVERHDQVPGLLGDPVAGGVPGHAE
jgi:hypothetical protein